MAGVGDTATAAMTEKLGQYSLSLAWALPFAEACCHFTSGGARTV